MTRTTAFFLAAASFLTASACSTPFDVDNGGNGGSSSGGSGGVGGTGGTGGTGGGVTGGTGGTMTGGTGGQGKPCGSFYGNVCGEKEYCEMEPGICSLAFLVAPGVPAERPAGGVADIAIAPAPQGQCRPIPFACLAIHAPVCGCNGITYGNDCVRAAAGVSKLHDGDCTSNIVVGEGESCGGFTAGPQRVCAADLFCEMSPGTCGVADNSGTCARVTQACIEIYAPVCGCDGKTYGNDCVRKSSRAQLAYQGACKMKEAGLGEVCGGIAGIACQMGLTCDTDPGMCTTADASGRCVQEPGTACDKSYIPVCGCDGRTYGNNCMRLRAGTPLDHKGACNVTSVLTPGVWGGPHIELKAAEGGLGAAVQFDCASAQIIGPLTVNADGTFSWQAYYYPGQGGPVANTGGSSGSGAAPIAPPQATFTGRIDGKTMTVTLRTQTFSAEYVLQLGVSGTLVRCL